MAKLPKEYNYAEAYLTLKCNFRCGYCVNDFEKVDRKRSELSGDEWIKLLNDIDFNDLSLTIGGGEPTLHRDFHKIINGLETKVDLLTNLTFDVDKFIKNVSPDVFTKSDVPFYHPIRASYHVGQSNEKELIAKTKKLRDNGFNVGLFYLFHPHNINENMKMAWLCAQEKIPIYPKDFLGEIRGKMYGFFKYPDGVGYAGGVGNEKKDVHCRIKELLISPEGTVHKCHRDLYQSENPTDIGYKFRPCKNFGGCNPCDLKLKTNKFLRAIDCQVEITK